MTFATRFLKNWLRNTSDNSPYERYEEIHKKCADETGAAPSLSCIGPELVSECLIYMSHTDKPLPRHLATTLALDLEHAISGREGEFFRILGHYSVNPSETIAQANAAEYANACKEHEEYCKINKIDNKWDRHYVKTIMDLCCVNRNTVHEWMKKYPHESRDRSWSQVEGLLDKVWSSKSVRMMMEKEGWKKE